MSDSETIQILKDEKLNKELLEFLNSNPTEEELHHKLIELYNMICYDRDYFIEIVESKLNEGMHDIEPEIAEVINDNFYELI